MKFIIEQELEEVESDSKYPESRPTGKKKLILEFDNDWPDDLVTLTADNKIIIHLEKNVTDFDK